MFSLFHVDLYSMHGDLGMGILLHSVVLMATGKYEKRTIFRTLRLHKYNKVNNPRGPKPHDNNNKDFASIMRESMKAQFHDFASIIRRSLLGRDVLLQPTTLLLVN